MINRYGKNLLIFVSFLFSSFGPTYPVDATPISVGDWTYDDTSVCSIYYHGWLGKKLTIQAYHFTSLDGPKKVYEIHFTPPLEIWNQLFYGASPIIVRSENLQRIFHYTGAGNSLDSREYGTHRLVNEPDHILGSLPNDLTFEDMNDFLEIISSGDWFEIATQHELIFEMEVEGTSEAILAFNECRAKWDL
jgi:hypothetical protein